MARWTEEGAAREADRAELADWVALGYPAADARDELARREQVRRES